MKKLYILLIICAAGFFTLTAAAQETPLENGIALYRQGKYAEAVKTLEGLSKTNLKNDAKLWNYLGLAYIERGDVKKGRKALEKSVKLAPQNSDFRTNLAFAYLVSQKVNQAQEQINKAIELNPQNTAAYYLRGTARLWERKFDQALADAERIIALDANFAAAYSLKADVLTAQFGNRVAKGAEPKEELDFLQKAIEALEYCVKNCQDNSSLRSQNEKLEALREFHAYFNRNRTIEPLQATAVAANSTPIKILSKPRPNYTDRARQANITGTIRAAVLFAANGRVMNVLILTPLGYGLDEQAVRAARGIKFEPATKDGKAVSVVKMVEYSFAIY